MSHFNYIVTAHNSEALINDVLAGVYACSGGRSTFRGTVWVVLDGCTDNTELVCDNVKRAGYPIEKVLAPDVHELLSINAGLRAAPQDGDGYNIILQDDVILECPDIEAQVEKLYASIPMLGYVSFRLGFNLSPELLSDRGFFVQVDEIESAYGAGVCGDVLMPGTFAYRTVPVKSPVCLPCKLVRELGMFNEDLAPYAYDDLELAIRTTMAGYRNGVYSIPFRSDVRWGGSRKPGHPDIMPTAQRNARYIAEKYAVELIEMTECIQRVGTARVVEVSDKQNAAAKERWAESQRVLAEMNH